MKNLLSCAVGVLLVAAGLRPAWADCAQVFRPGDALYTTLTNKCSIGTVPFSISENCEVLGEVVATFDPSLQVRMVPDSWSTWGSPPVCESATPTVGFTPTERLRVTLLNDSTSAGMEFEPNAFGLVDVTVSFKDANLEEVFVITRTVTGSAGAMLFAAECDCRTSIRYLDVSEEGVPGGFAIAQVRSDGFPPGFTGDGAPR